MNDIPLGGAHTKAYIDQQLKAYLLLMNQESIERRFTTRVSWALDGVREVAEDLPAALSGQACRLAEIDPPPKVSIITALYNTTPAFLEDLILSCRCQSWQSWELVLADAGSTESRHIRLLNAWQQCDDRIRLCDKRASMSGARNAALAAASGDIICFLGQHDVLHPAALGLVVRYMRANSGANFLFSNEANIDARYRTSGFLSKPDFDVFTLLRVNYVCRLAAMRRALAFDENGNSVCLEFRAEFEGSEEHDFFLRIALYRRVSAVHMPVFLYYKRQGVDVLTGPDRTRQQQANSRMLLDHLARVYGPDGYQAPHIDQVTGRVHIHPRIRGAKPSLLVVVPFKDHASLTIRCLESLERQQHHLNVLVVLVDNNSVRAETLSSIRDWTNRERSNTYQLISYSGAFNFAKINNSVVRTHGRTRDLILLLNNDVELISQNVLDAMAAQLLSQPDSGFVGIRLLYPGDRKVQHGGVRVISERVGPGYYAMGHAEHPNEFVEEDHIVLAVTFACAMTRRLTYEQLGGLEEELLPIGYGDVDMCVRAVRAGLRNYYFGTLEGLHYESRSRKSQPESSEVSVILDERVGGSLNRWRLRHLAIGLHPSFRARKTDAQLIASYVSRAYEILISEGPAELAKRMSRRLLRRLARAQLLEFIRPGASRLVGMAHWKVTGLHTGAGRSDSPRPCEPDNAYSGLTKGGGAEPPQRPPGE